jgi:hypothetical protein
MDLLSAAHRAASSALLVLACAGCASFGNPGMPPEKAVAERAQARWDALIESNWAVAYGYMTPAYRAVVPLKRFGSQFSGPARWEEAKVTGAKCEDKRCVVSVAVGLRLLIPAHADRVTTTHIDEVWLLEEGQWYKFEPL